MLAYITGTVDQELLLRNEPLAAENLIGSVRRDCLNHVIVLNKRHLKPLLRSYFSNYHTAQTHLALDKQTPQFRQVESPDRGSVVAFPHLGGLHHEYRRAA